MLTRDAEGPDSDVSGRPSSGGNFWDCGLLGTTLAPNFPSDPYVYVLYTYDAAIGGTALRWGTSGVDSDTCPTPLQARLRMAAWSAHARREIANQRRLAITRRRAVRAIESC